MGGFVVACSVKVDFVNPFVAGAMATFAQELQQQPRVGQVTATVSPLRSSGVSVLIGMTGQVRGVVIYDMVERTAKAIASCMVGAPVPLFDELAESAIAELGNIITGHASAGLEEGDRQVAITPPSIITGRGVHLAVPETARLVVPLELPFGTVWVYLALHET